MILGQVQLIMGLFIVKKKARGPFLTEITLFTWKNCGHTFALKEGHVALRLLNDSSPPWKSLLQPQGRTARGKRGRKEKMCCSQLWTLNHCSSDLEEMRQNWAK